MGGFGSHFSGWVWWANGFRLILPPLSKMDKWLDKKWASLLKAQYLKGIPFMQAKKTASSSWQWKGILNSRSIIKKGLRTKIGNGRHINLGSPLDPHPWRIHPQHKLTTTSIEFLISSVKIPTNGIVEKLPLFDSLTARKTLSIHLSSRQPQDKHI